MSFRRIVASSSLGLGGAVLIACAAGSLDQTSSGERIAKLEARLASVEARLGLSDGGVPDASAPSYWFDSNGVRRFGPRVEEDASADAGIRLKVRAPPEDAGTEASAVDSLCVQQRIEQCRRIAAEELARDAGIVAANVIKPTGKREVLAVLPEPEASDAGRVCAASAQETCIQHIDTPQAWEARRRLLDARIGAGRLDTVLGLELQQRLTKALRLSTAALRVECAPELCRITRLDGATVLNGVSRHVGWPHTAWYQRNVAYVSRRGFTFGW